MKPPLCGLLYLTILSGGAAADSQSPGKIAPTFETTPKFHHRAFEGTILLDNYLYIDGDEITTWNGLGDSVQTESVQNGTKNGNIITRPSNWTYAIDLSTSWTDRSVNLKPIHKDSPPLNREALWLLRRIFKLLDNAPGENQFWQFHPSGDSGHWTQESVITPVSRPPLVEVDQAFYASGNNLGFAIGGVESVQTNYDYYSGDVNAWRRIPGIVIFNETSKEWFNASTRDFTYNGLAIQGAAPFVPNFGPEGLLFAFGGTNAQDPTTENNIPIPLDTAYIFEPVARSWQKQKVTGDYPLFSTDQCVVGLEGDDQTYEIFMYGGRNPDEDVEKTVNLGALWVLSLPAFHWERQSDPVRVGRFYHSCQVAGNSNRQMISAGGIVAMDQVDQDDLLLGSADPWDQGIGVFDMSQMEWKDSFDHTAASYVTPSIIKDYLARNSRYPSWDHDVLGQWFVDQARFTRSSPNGGDSRSSTSAIAGGVVGGIAGLTITSAIITFAVIRRKRRREAAWDQGPGKDDYWNEMDAAHGRVELSERGDPEELSGRRDPAEHAGSPLYELESKGRLSGWESPNGISCTPQANS